MAYLQPKKNSKNNKKERADIIDSNKGLVVHIAKKYLNCGLELEDLIQEGLIGLIKALDRFEPDRGYQFSTYATWWVRQAVTTAVANNGRMIRIPVHVIETINKISRASHHLIQELGREPTVEELSKATEYSPAKIKKAMNTVNEPFSLQTSFTDNESQQVQDIIPDQDAEDAFELVVVNSLKDQVRKMLMTLLPKQEMIIRMRFGIGEVDGEGSNLYDIGKKVGVSDARVQQIEMEALERLRRRERLKYVKDFVA